MRVDRLGKLYEQKYSLAAPKEEDVPEGVIPAPYAPAEPSVAVKPGLLPTVTHPLPHMADVEAKIRNSLDILWNIPNKLFNVIKECAEAAPAHPEGEHEEEAVRGARFCKQVMSIVDTLKAKRDTLSLSEIRRGLETLQSLIHKNRVHKEDEKSFPHVIALIFEMVPHGKKYERRLRDQYYQKARKGFSRMNSIIKDILDYMNKVGGSSEETAPRFENEPTPLSIPEIEKFIRMHGDTYGIPDMATWSLALDTDPSLEAPLRKLVHALDRGHILAGADKIKPIIQNIIRRRQQPFKTNVPVLEQAPPATPGPLLPSFEEEEGEAWDHKMASKYNDLTLRRYINENR